MHSDLRPFIAKDERTRRPCKRYVDAVPWVPGQFVCIMDHRLIEGTLPAQVEEAMAFIQKNLHVRVEITGAPVRQEIWDYPLVALREALVNSICHRDYGDTADIKIKILENSLQIWIPGTLPHGISVQDLFNLLHTSRLRNKLAAQVFFDLGLIERYGGEIERIQTACAAAGLPPPELETLRMDFECCSSRRRKARRPLTKSPLRSPLKSLPKFNRCC